MAKGRIGLGPPPTPGQPLVDATEGPMTISWTAQFDMAENGTAAACEGALGDFADGVDGTNGSSEGGLFLFSR